MSEFRRRLMMAGGGGSLPYDEELAFIEGTGTQWIDTGLYFDTTKHGYELDAMFIDDLTGTRSLIGVWGPSWNSNSMSCAINGNYQDGYFSCPAVNFRAAQTMTALALRGVRNKVGFVNNGLNSGAINVTRYVNGVASSIIMTNPYIGTTSHTFPLFGVKGSGGNNIGEIPHLLLFGFKMYDKGDIIMDLIPVRVEQMGFMYDKISGTFFENKGSGNFNIYPKNKPYDAEIEYIEGTGTQCIDTGLYFDTTKNGFEIDAIYYNDLSGTRTICGSYESSFNYDHLCCTMVGSYNNSYFACPSPNFRGGSVDAALGQPGVRNKIGFINHGLENGVINITRNVNGVSENIVMSNPYIGVTSMTFPIFGVKNSFSINEIPHLRLYGFKMYDKDNIIADMIPVRIGEAGFMYDKIRKTIHGNAGSGKFTLGNDIN